MTKSANKSLHFLFEIRKLDEQTDRDLIREVSQAGAEHFGSRLRNESYYEDDPLGQQACWTCGGDPDSHPSGSPCICGDGSHKSEVANLRALAYKNSSTNQAIQEDLMKRNDKKGEGENEKTHKKDMDSEKWNPQWLRGYLIEIFNLEPTADNWNILEAVRMDGIHWRHAIFKIQQIIGLESADGPMTVNAVRERLQSGDLMNKLRELREENARLHGVIEGMGKR